VGVFGFNIAMLVAACVNLDRYRLVLQQKNPAQTCEPNCESSKPVI